MVFSSILFAFVFLPAVLFFYYIADKQLKNILLLVASLIFYGIGEPKAVVLMIVSIILNYFAGLAIGRVQQKQKAECLAGNIEMDHNVGHYIKLSRVILAIDVAANLGILFYFKYLNYTVKLFGYLTGNTVEALNIALPIGISFFTFQAMSYVIDVYRGEVEAEKNILNVGLYISFFPQLVAGPIVRYKTIAEQIKDRNVDLEKFGQGATRFLTGFFKKIILANNLALIADGAFNYWDLKSLPMILAWVGTIAFSLQIYFDFSGYSDMAIGLGKMFGFEFPENFNYPYISESVTDFWRRWHISLSSWFRDYVYIPLGGSRVAIPRRIINLFVVWALTGLWHGANLTFVAWGLMYFAILVFEKYVVKPEGRTRLFKVLWRLATLFTVNAGWILFNTESFTDAVYIMKSMLGLYGNELFDTLTISLLRENGLFFVMGIIFSMPVLPAFVKYADKSSRLKDILDYLIPLLYACAFIWSVSFLILGAHNPFIYFNF